MTSPTSQGPGGTGDGGHGHVAVSFPDDRPNGYEWLDGEPVFDPECHLALTEPEEIVTLADLGYGADEIAGKATTVAITSPFRILSDDGAAQMLDTARRLRRFCRRADVRIEKHGARRGVPVAMVARPVPEP